MCAPIALAGLQLVSSFAAAQAQSQQANLEARLAERDGKIRAAAAAARAEYLRDQAGREQGSRRAEVSTHGVDPASASALATLAAAHARGLDAVKDAEFAGRTALDESQIRAQTIKRQARAARVLSLLGAAETLANSRAFAHTIYVPH